VISWLLLLHCEIHKDVEEVAQVSEPASSVHEFTIKNGNDDKIIEVMHIMHWILKFENRAMLQLS
jgi:hypothetical protein